jgi:HK97 family phage portal protein
MFKSGGVLLKTPSITHWSGTTRTWPDSLQIGTSWMAYSELYRKQLWVFVLVNKIANATARLPLKVYRRREAGRDDARDSAYGQLLASPSSQMDPFLFWLWTRSTIDIHGEAFWGKIRDGGGRPVELVPFHPRYIFDDLRNGQVTWRYESSDIRIDNIARRDLVHFRTFNPDSLRRGLSPLEPLRSTLENEDGARRANSSMWKRGARPSLILEHPASLSEPAIKRLSTQMAELHGGADNWGKALIVEEAMKANVIPLNVEDLQYVESRKLNREEVCAAYDVPPPVVHILDRATFSNITEQMRSMYRDTMAPKLGLLESTLEFELRDGRFGDDAEPDFGADVYAEFLMDGVLRGDFEKRTAAYQQAIQSGWMTRAEVRELENLPYIDGTDVLVANAALQPLLDEGANDALELPMVKPMLALPPAPVRSLLGRLGRCRSLDDLDVSTIESVELAEAISEWKAQGLTVEAVRAHLGALMRNEAR